MKKYIKTEDGVFNKDNIFILEINKISKHPINSSFKQIRLCNKDDILKQSNNLKELCDVFVLPRLFEPIYEKNDKKVHFLHGVCGYDVYGAVWTDKGLIYVAKMNNKGKLELL